MKNHQNKALITPPDNDVSDCNTADKRGGRISYIDLAKGLCILMVISFHADLEHVIYFTPKISGYFGSFRIPFYFLLSGLFVSFSSGYKIFFQKKINKLIVPFCFFVFLTNLMMWIGKDLMHGYERGLFTGKFEWISPIQVAYYEFSHGLNNTPLWFLVALFNAYICFMAVDYLAHNKMWLKGVLSLLVGGLGYLLGWSGINLPFHIDDGLCALPFLYAGELLRRKTALLVDNQYDRWNILISLGLFIVLIFTTPDSYAAPQNFLQRYFNGICGAIAILLLCKQIKRLPVISFVGRYSIIFLGLHQIMVGHVTNLLSRFLSNPLMLEMSVIAMIVAVCSLSTVLLKNFLPWFCAQKDLVYFTGPIGAKDVQMSE